MMKRNFLAVFVFTFFIMCAPILAPGFALAVDDNPAYGETVKTQLLTDIMSNLDELATGDEASQFDAISLKKKVSELSSVVMKNEASPARSLSIQKKISQIYTSINELLSKKKSDKDGKINVLISKIDKVAAQAGNFDSCNGLKNEELKQKLHELIKDHKQLGYNEMARKVLFGKLDNVGGKVQCVYTGRWVECDGVPNANPPQAMNTEHTWPKCYGALNEPAKSDLNHLFATDSFANSTRSNYPFGMVTRGHEVWEQNGSMFDGNTFMPREEQRGPVARALFYFSICYQLPLYSDQDEQVLRQWHKQYPPTDAERSRNERIFGFQGNRNPFIDRPELVDQIDKF
ncbi:MAG: endonuclease [Candidatus Wallbacteria bacterium]